MQQLSYISYSNTICIFVYIDKEQHIHC